MQCQASWERMERSALGSIRLDSRCAAVGVLRQGHEWQDGEEECRGSHDGSMDYCTRTVLGL